MPCGTCRRAKILHHKYISSLQATKLFVLQQIISFSTYANQEENLKKQIGKKVRGRHP
jgi:hypothetical protein